MCASTASAAAPLSPQQVNPWAVLTAMSGGAPAAAICGSAAVTAAAQPSGGCVLPVAEAPPPPPPLPEAGPPPPPPVVATAGAGISPLLIGLVAIAAGVGFYLAIHNSGHHANSPA